MRPKLFFNFVKSRSNFTFAYFNLICLNVGYATFQDDDTTLCLKKRTKFETV